MTPLVTARRAYPARRRAAVLALLVVPLVGACMRGRLPPRELYRLVLADSARVETPLAAPSTVVPASGSIAIAFRRWLCSSTCVTCAASAKIFSTRSRFP